MLDTSCSRVSLPRSQIEKLGDVQLSELARTHHDVLFKMIDEQGIKVESILVKRRPGLYISLDLKVPPTFTNQHLRKLLEGLVKEKIHARKDAKKRRREASLDK
jgi:hypothetical protein